MKLELPCSWHALRKEPTAVGIRSSQPGCMKGERTLPGSASRRVLFVLAASQVFLNNDQSAAENTHLLNRSSYSPDGYE